MPDKPSKQPLLLKASEESSLVPILIIIERKDKETAHASSILGGSESEILDCSSSVGQGWHILGIDQREIWRAAQQNLPWTQVWNEMESKDTD